MVEWLGHACFKIKGSKVIYFDPYDIQKNEKADIILVTHGHYDHFSPDDIRKILKNDTVVVAPKDCAGKISVDMRTSEIGKTINIGNISVTGVPAYNIDKKFHPKGSVVGIIAKLDGVKIYHAGDTDFIPEMKDLKVDIALLPVGGTYTMNAEEAAKAANTIKPKLAIPMHYGKIVGSKSDAEKFKSLCNVDVKILG